jgi:hypothetical protein
MDGSAGTLPYAIVTEVTQVDTRWAMANYTAYVSGVYSSEQVVATGVGQFYGGLWLPAEALRARIPRSRLDRDPITGAEITWQRGPGGILVLTERGAAYETSLSYNGSDGALLGIVQTTQGAVATIVTELNLVE